MKAKLTAYDNPTVGSGTVVNDVQFAYNDFGQLTADYQSHSGAVNVSTTPNVQYGYASGAANTIRPTTLTYPNGRVLTFSYGTSGGISDHASRVASLIDNDGTTHLVDYDYLGRGTFVVADDTQPDVKWTLVDLSGSNDPDTGDIYSGLDRFGRVKDNRWYDYGSSTDVDRIKYGYDRAGNRIWRENVVAASLSKEFDELYSYDGVHRLADMGRGLLNSQHSTLTSQLFAQCWSLDATGNWSGFRQDDTGDGTWDLVQARTANPVNEITDITNSVGSAWIDPAYSAAGNITTMPQPNDPTQSYAATYDAWNRLVKLVDGSNTVSEYAYDGAKRRVIQKTYSAGSLSETRHLYYTEPSQWQVVEERVDSSSNAQRQFVWGLRYIDDCVLRDRDTSGNGTLDERLYACQDANWNVDALVDTAGDVQERYAYSAYGVPMFLTAGFGSRSASSYDWESLYCGYRYETGTGVFHVRHRIYLTSLGTWTERDPLGYVDGLNDLAYVRSNPLGHVDPSGLAVGVQTKGYCCVRRAPLSPWCICVDWEVDFGAEFCCCRNGQRTTVGEFKVCVTVGYYLCNTKNIGMSWFKQFECRVTPAKKRGGTGLTGTCRLGGCPPEGCSGRVCAQASIGYAAATVGLRLCYGTEGYSFEFGYGIGTGTGVGGGGCINCVT